ncbi:hypothetical protein HAX54_025129 [Datura stramonium]|uniref:Acyl-[acyl-carrier-protein] hydrolase n=1 Tax=Datura stramonium TaxID=4076 RepID=A0ABS8S654_DATST|nr:hypothetical protein [Datura stramonium]
MPQEFMTQIMRNQNRESVSIKASVKNVRHMKYHPESRASSNPGSSSPPSSSEHPYLLGNFVDDWFVYRQSFVIRSYEIGPDKTATMETIMNLLQETALNHVASSGVGSNGFGATRQMSLRKLIWVVTRIHIQVEQYSSWGDVVEIDTWVDAAGKNGMRRDWIIRDSNTHNIITKATSRDGERHGCQSTSAMSNILDGFWRYQLSSNAAVRSSSEREWQHPASDENSGTECTHLWIRDGVIEQRLLRPGPYSDQKQ